MTDGGAQLRHHSRLQPSALLSVPSAKPSPRKTIASTFIRVIRHPWLIPLRLRARLFTTDFTDFTDNFLLTLSRSHPALIRVIRAASHSENQAQC